MTKIGNGTKARERGATMVSVMLMTVSLLTISVLMIRSSKRELNQANAIVARDRALEAACSRRLFVRDTHSVAITVHGEAMLGFARSILDTLERAQRHFGEAVRGRVRFGVSDLGGTSTISLSVNYLAPGRTALVAHARLLRAGSTIAFAAGEILDESGTLVATAQGTFRLIRKRA